MSRVHCCKPRYAACCWLIAIIVGLNCLGGCVANSSNPVVSIGSASIKSESADVTLHLTNPGGRDLTITRIEYELSHGEMGFPVGEGIWSGQLDLPAGGETPVAIHIPFVVEPIESDSKLLHLNGLLYMQDHTGFLGLSSMDLTQSPFQLDFEAIGSDR